MLEFTGKSFVNKKSLKKNVLPRVYINKNLIYLMCEKKRFSTDNKKSIGQENLIFMTYGHSHMTSKVVYSDLPRHDIPVKGSK
jgi:hypothetical protein